MYTIPKYFYISDAVEFSVRVSFLELYNEEIFDLLSGNEDHSKLRLYEDAYRKGSVIIQGMYKKYSHKNDTYIKTNFSV